MLETNKPWYKRWWGFAIVIFFTIILIFLVAVGFYVNDSVKTAKKPAGLKLNGQTYQAANSDSYWLGSAKPKITIVEFGDFACPFSEQAFPTVREISLKYKNDVKFIWRDYPVVQEYSALLALAGRCAGEQGLFWPMHDKLFQNQGVSAADQLAGLANQVGADLTRFNDCLNKQKYLDISQEHLCTYLMFVHRNKIQKFTPPNHCRRSFVIAFFDKSRPEYSC